MPRPALTLAVVGADFPNKRGPGRRFEIALCVPGEPVELRHEPKNPADPRAIAVYSHRGVQIGYLAAERAPLIGKHLHDIRAVFQGKTARGALVRASFDGSEPTLPPDPVPGRDWPDDEFWPDDIPADE